MKQRKAVKRISDKKLAQNGGRMPRSSITSQPEAKPKRKKKPVGRGAMMQRRSKIAKANPERQKKAAKRYAQKLAKYRASETYKLVEARSGGRCEFVNLHPEEWVPNPSMYRCGFDATDHHHLRYAQRFGGKELPEDIQHLCAYHHDLVESLKPAGNRRSRRVA